MGTDICEAMVQTVYDINSAIFNMLRSKVEVFECERRDLIETIAKADASIERATGGKSTVIYTSHVFRSVLGDEASLLDKRIEYLYCLPSNEIMLMRIGESEADVPATATPVYHDDGTLSFKVCIVNTAYAKSIVIRQSSAFAEDFAKLQVVGTSIRQSGVSAERKAKRR